MVSPLQKYNSKNKERWTVLQDMPEWIVGQVVDWLTNIYYNNYGELRSSVLSNIQTKLRLILRDACGFDMPRRSSTFNSRIVGLFASNEEEALLFLDITVKYIRDYAPLEVPYSGQTIKDKNLLAYINRTLANGSKWEVIEESHSESGIRERAEGKVAELAEEVNEDHLTKAWNLAFQLNPDPEKAVEEAQKAVEAVASEAGLTNLTTKVYGGLIGDIKAHPDKYINVAKEAYGLHDNINKTSNMINEKFSIWVADGLDFIQKTHPARHKSKAVNMFELSPEAAQQAIVVATLICWLISRGYFQKETAN
jgi:hypothetical protein